MEDQLKAWIKDLTEAADGENYDEVRRVAAEMQGCLIGMGLFAQAPVITPAPWDGTTKTG